MLTGIDPSTQKTVRTIPARPATIMAGNIYSVLSVVVSDFCSGINKKTNFEDIAGAIVHPKTSKYSHPKSKYHHKSSYIVNIPNLSPRPIYIAMYQNALHLFQPCYRISYTPGDPKPVIDFHDSNTGRGTFDFIMNKYAYFSKKLVPMYVGQTLKKSKLNAEAALSQQTLQSQIEYMVANGYFDIEPVDMNQKNRHFVLTPAADLGERANLFKKIRVYGKTALEITPPEHIGGATLFNGNKNIWNAAQLYRGGM